MREQNDIEYFNSVWEDSDRLKIHLLLLAEKGVYRADDPRLVSAIVELCEPIPQGPLDEHLALSQKCANKPVPKLLRDLKQRGSPPFHPVGRFVSIGVPGKDDQPRIGKASTCLNGELYRRKLRLVNTDNEKTVTVLADRHYGEGVGCGSTFGTADLQLNVDDALSLFDGPLDRLETALAVVN